MPSVKETYLLQRLADAAPSSGPMTEERKNAAIGTAQLIERWLRRPSQLLFGMHISPEESASHARSRR